MTARHAAIAAQAELDQAVAGMRCYREFLDALEPWATDPARSGWTLAAIVADVQRIDPAACRSLMRLHDAAFPTVVTAGGGGDV
jgi:hypothetical protein